MPMKSITDIWVRQLSQSEMVSMFVLSLVIIISSQSSVNAFRVSVGIDPDYVVLQQGTPVTSDNGIKCYIPLSSSLQQIQWKNPRGTTVVRCDNPGSGSSCVSSVYGYSASVKTVPHDGQRVESYLHISNVSRADEGLWLCEVLDSYGIAGSSSKRMYIYHPARDLSCNHSLDNNGAEIRCATNYIYPKASCTWKIDDIETTTLPQTTKNLPQQGDNKYFSSTCSLQLKKEPFQFKAGQINVSVSMHSEIHMGSIDQNVLTKGVSRTQVITIEKPRSAKYKFLNGTRIKTNYNVIPGEEIDFVCYVYHGKPHVESATLSCQFPIARNGNQSMTRPGVSVTINATATEFTVGKTCSCYGEHLTGQTVPTILTFVNKHTTPTTTTITTTTSSPTTITTTASTTRRTMATAKASSPDTTSTTATTSSTVSSTTTTTSIPTTATSDKYDDLFTQVNITDYFDEDNNSDNSDNSSVSILAIDDNNNNTHDDLENNERNGNYTDDEENDNNDDDNGDHDDGDDDDGDHDDDDSYDDGYDDNNNATDTECSDNNRTGTCNPDIMKSKQKDEDNEGEGENLTWVWVVAGLVIFVLVIIIVVVIFKRRRREKSFPLDDVAYNARKNETDESPVENGDDDNIKYKQNKEGSMKAVSQ